MIVDIGDPRLITTWHAIRQAGVTPDRIRAQLAARRWRRWGHAIAFHNGPLSQGQQWQFARLHAGPRSLLTAFTLLEAMGLRTWERRATHVLAPMGARVLPGCPFPLKVNRVRDWDRVQRGLGHCHHHVVDALLRASASLDGPRPACAIAVAAVQQRLVTPREIRAGLDRSPRLSRRQLLWLTVADIEQGADAQSEIDFVKLCRRHGLPLPVQQRVRPQPDGRRRYLDASWRRADGRLVVAEVDGALHLSQRRWWADQLRQNELTIGDAMVLRYPSAVVRTEPAVVADQLRRALRV